MTSVLDVFPVLEVLELELPARSILYYATVVEQIANRRTNLKILDLKFFVFENEEFWLFTSGSVSKLFLNSRRLEHVALAVTARFDATASAEIAWYFSVFL